MKIIHKVRFDLLNKEDSNIFLALEGQLSSSMLRIRFKIARTKSIPIHDEPPRTRSSERPADFRRMRERLALH